MKENERNFTIIHNGNIRAWKQVAFTLAEAIIVIAIIGVVAAITLPTLISDFSNKIYDAREKNISSKVSQAVLTMKAMNDLGTIYESTDDFVDELEKHLKIIKRCDASHLTECWPSKKVINSLKKTVEVSEYTTGRNFHVFSSPSDVVGLVLGDGAPIILAYTPTPIDMTDSIDKALGVIDFVMDVNGAAGPNSEKTGDDVYDIRSFRIASFEDYTGSVSGKKYTVIRNDNYTWQEASGICKSLGMHIPKLWAGVGVALVSDNSTLIKDTGTYWAAEACSDGVRAVYDTNISKEGCAAVTEKLKVICSE